MIPNIPAPGHCMIISTMETLANISIPVSWKQESHTTWGLETDNRNVIFLLW